VHSTVDAPLKSVSIEQTWGISIAIFTAGEFDLWSNVIDVHIAKSSNSYSSRPSTSAIRSLLIPLSFQQNKSTEYMKALKPYLAEIKESSRTSLRLGIAPLEGYFLKTPASPFNGCLLSLAFTRLAQSVPWYS
jgi:YidC/Oxa1 family membrane protein insertase